MRTRTRLLGLGGILLALVGCVVSIPEGAPCGTDRDCPAEQTCQAAHCSYEHLSGDAGTFDAGTFDAGTLDGGGCGPRDCQLDADNDCNGMADNTESAYCQCPAGTARACVTGLSGICSAGSQPCVLSGNRSSTAWGTCAQVTPKGTETCANPGSDDDCDTVTDNVQVASCDFGTGLGACLNGGYTGCNGLTPVCNAAAAGLGDASTWHTGPAPNGSWDWDCDGVVTKLYPDVAPDEPVCAGLDMSSCGAQAQLSYALNSFGCGTLGNIGTFYCAWMASIPGCVNKSGQSNGYEQACR